MRASVSCLALVAAACLAALHGAPAESIAGLLDVQFPDENVSYLVVDVKSEEVLAARWKEVDRPLPPGSLVKPFSALAYAENHSFKFPKYNCRGESQGCWWAQGHGKLNLEQALAHSCNAYFLQLVAHMHPSELRVVTARYGLRAPAENVPVSALLGLGEEWQLSPLEIARSYARLAQQPHGPVETMVLRGLLLSSREGTAREAGRVVRQPLLAKTGTAPCLHGESWNGDGFVLMLYPADRPRFSFLVRVHGVPGATAARTGGEMLRALLAILDGETG